MPRLSSPTKRSAHQPAALPRVHGPDAVAFDSETVRDPAAAPADVAAYARVAARILSRTIVESSPQLRDGAGGVAELHPVARKGRARPTRAIA